MTVGVACGSCGIDLRDNAKFCDECGAPTVVSADTAEYKQVTVLFADVVRSMDLAAVLDAERFREIMTELVERGAAVVQRYGGTVEYTGDGRRVPPRPIAKGCPGIRYRREIGSRCRGRRSVQDRGRDALGPRPVSQRIIAVVLLERLQFRAVLRTESRHRPLFQFSIHAIPEESSLALG
jgi:hypothetical protein